MKNTIKNLVAGILTLSVFTMTTNVYAATGTSNSLSTSTYADISPIKEYIESCVPYHIVAQNITTDPYVTYCEPIPLYNFNDFTTLGYETFIIDGDEIIGKMDIYTGDKYTSLFDTQITDEIAAAYENGTELAIGYYNDSLLIYTEENGYSLVDGIYSGCPIEAPSMSMIISTNRQISSSTHSRAYLGSKVLNITHVPNSTTYNSSGQCWAACCAMVLNYKIGTSLTADIIYKLMTDNGLSHHSPDAYDYFGYSYTIQRDVTPDCGAMSSNEVWNQINNQNRPVSITVKNPSSTNSHQVVICGMTVDSSYTTYTIDNPNTATKQTFTIDGNPTTISEDISYGNYTKWYQSIY